MDKPNFTDVIQKINQGLEEGIEAFEIHCTNQEMAREISEWMKKNHPDIPHKCIWIEPSKAMLERQTRQQADLEKLERWKIACQ